MKKKPLFIILLAFALLLGGCSAQPEPQKLSFVAMDTFMTVTAYGADDGLMTGIREKIEDLEALFSVTREDSEIYALNNTGHTGLSDDTLTLMTRALEICRLTGGALDISVYPVVRAWGFTTGEYRVPDQAEIDALLADVGYESIELDGNEARLPEGMMVDLGSIAKGYTGDVLAAMLKDGGVSSALMDLGGNIQTVGMRPDGEKWRVGVQDPFGDSYVGVLSIADKAAVTSGGYERYFIADDGTRYCHIIDPATGRPAQSGIASVTVTAESGTYCDGLSTSLFVMGLEDGSELWRGRGDFDAVFITDSGDLYITEGLEGNFEPEDGVTVNIIRRDER